MEAKKRTRKDAIISFDKLIKPVVKIDTRTIYIVTDTDGKYVDTLIGFVGKRSRNTIVKRLKTKGVSEIVIDILGTSYIVIKKNK